jgi:hypothetical protein
MAIRSAAICFASAVAGAIACRLSGHDGQEAVREKAGARPLSVAEPADGAVKLSGIDW